MIAIFVKIVVCYSKNGACLFEKWFLFLYFVFKFEIGAKTTTFGAKKLHFLCILV